MWDSRVHGARLVPEGNMVYVSMVNSHFYFTPEVIRKAGHGKSVDMWSIGVLAYFL